MPIRARDVLDTEPEDAKERREHARVLAARRRFSELTETERVELLKKIAVKLGLCLPD